MASSKEIDQSNSIEKEQNLLSGYKENEKQIKANDKTAVNDFISSEAGRPSINPEILHAQTYISIEPDDSRAAVSSESVNNGSKIPDEILTTGKQVNGCKNVNPGPETDIESSNASRVPNEVSEANTSNFNFDDNLPSTVTLLRAPGGCKCYLVGTAHFSIESQNDVAKVIRAVQPDLVMVELCKDRIHVLRLDEETILEESKNLKMSKILNIIKQYGAYNGLFYILLLNLSAHLTKVLGMAPGGEFRAAFNEAKKIPNCIIQMGDRPIKITFARAFSSLSWWQTIKLTWHLLREKQPISQEDVEKYKRKDSLEQIMAQLVGEYPELGKVFVKERDIFLTHSLQLACEPTIGPFGEVIPTKVVGVVGIGHTLGIIENWGKVDRSQIIPIMSIPPTSMTTKILKLSFRASIVSLGVYASYKIGCKVFPASVNVVQFIKSSFDGLTKVSASKLIRVI